MKMRKSNRFILIVNFIIILLTMILGYNSINSSAETEKYELSRDISEIEANHHEYCIIMLISKIQEEIKFVQDEEFIEDDEYLLAKIVMAEAEGLSIETKILVAMTVLNRVESKDFPDSILEVIFQNDGKTYQFSPVMPGGRWWTTEPNKDCYKAVEIALSNEYDCSDGALYFESCEDEDNWHSNNLEFLYQSEDLRFYK